MTPSARKERSESLSSFELHFDHLKKMSKLSEPRNKQPESGGVLEQVPRSVLSGVLKCHLHVDTCRYLVRNEFFTAFCKNFQA